MDLGRTLRIYLLGYSNMTNTGGDHRFTTKVDPPICFTACAMLVCLAMSALVWIVPCVCVLCRCVCVSIAFVLYLLSQRRQRKRIRVQTQLKWAPPHLVQTPGEKETRTSSRSSHMYHSKCKKTNSKTAHMYKKKTEMMRTILHVSSGTKTVLCFLMSAHELRTLL